MSTFIAVSNTESPMLLSTAILISACNVNYYFGKFNGIQYFCRSLIEAFQKDQAMN